jgi:large conductance mechanosensitive channel
MDNNLMNGGSSFVKEFFDFLQKFGVIGLAIGIVVGGAVKDYVDTIVKSLVTPFINYILSLINFKAGGAINLPAVMVDGKEVTASLLIGDVISSTVNFLVLMFLVFIVVKMVISKFMHESDMKNTGV